MSSPRFFVYERLLELATEVRRCYASRPHLHNLSRTQFLFELDVFDAIADSPLRTFDRREASVFLLPLLTVLSSQTGTCDYGRCKVTTHRTRIAADVAAVQQEVDWSAGPHLLTCTCVMQRVAYGPTLFGLVSKPTQPSHELRPPTPSLFSTTLTKLSPQLLNHSSSLVALTHARRGPPYGPARVHVIAPYHTPMLGHNSARGASCMARPVLATFAGSPDTGRPNATCARHHIFALGRADARSFAVRATQRHHQGTRCAVSGSCVNGFYHSPAFEAHGGAKAAMADMMGAANFCLVPEGDSPESSRLFDAVAALCTPVVVTNDHEGLLVPHSRHWAAATLVISEVDFMRMDAAELVAWLRSHYEAGAGSAKRRCDALRSLREDMLAPRVLARAVRVAANLSRAYSSGDVIADAHALRPRPIAQLAGGVRARRRSLPRVRELVSFAPDPVFNSSRPRAIERVLKVDAATGQIEVMGEAGVGRTTVCPDDYNLHGSPPVQGAA